MIDVSSNFKFAVLNGTSRNEIHIEVFGYNPDGSNLHIHNKNIVSESMVIEQAISDESDLKFGGCIASSFEVELSNTPDLTGKYITVTITQTAKSKLYPGMQTVPGSEIYPGDVRLTSEASHAEEFVWQDMLYNRCMLLSLKTQRYVGKNPVDGSPYSADYQGADAGMKNGCVFTWEVVE